MDKLVKQVTVVRGSGPTRETKVVYEEKQQDYPTFPMDDSVSCVTVIRGNGERREAKTIYRSPRWPDTDESSRTFERGFRRFLKADMIRAQDAYQRHIETAEDDGKTWWLDIPANFARAFIEADKKTRKQKREERAKQTPTDLG